MNDRKTTAFATTLACLTVLLVFGFSLIAPHLAWSMGTPPFDVDLRSAFGVTMKASLDTKGCLGTDETIEVTSRYRKLKGRTPLADKKVTATVAFPGRDSKGSRLIAVNYTLTTNADGEVNFLIPMTQALADARQALQSDRFYRGVKRVRGRINISLYTEDALKQSVRLVPARGLYFRLCRTAPPAE